MKQLPFILLFTAALHLRAMGRFEALSMIESGDRDNARGPNGEVTRYQISPETLKEFGLSRQDVATEPPALSLAKHIMQIRIGKFSILHHRQPTDTEWYLLWHRPGRVERPTARELERARRFANLVNRKEDK